MDSKSNKYFENKASEEEIYQHLVNCNETFFPSLSEYVDLQSYSGKLKNFATNLELWNNEVLVGLISFYIEKKEPSLSFFISNVSVLPEFQSKGVFSFLFERLLEKAKGLNVGFVDLEVNRKNQKVLNLYQKKGFVLKNNPEGDVLKLRKIVK